MNTCFSVASSCCALTWRNACQGKERKDPFKKSATTKRLSLHGNNTYQGKERNDEENANLQKWNQRLKCNQHERCR